MGSKNQTDINLILATMVAAVGFTTSAGATGKVAGPPRGPDIQPIAGGCNIGTFPQTTKAGQYNALCNTMQDAEKCLALIKGHFNSDGSIRHKNSDTARLTYCLDELGKVLGADETP